jgi:hypothetical protein
VVVVGVGVVVVTGAAVVVGGIGVVVVGLTHPCSVQSCPGPHASPQNWQLAVSPSGTQA